MNVPSDLLKNQQGGSYGAPTKKILVILRSILLPPCTLLSKSEGTFTLQYFELKKKLQCSVQRSSIFGGKM